MNVVFDVFQPGLITGDTIFFQKKKKIAIITVQGERVCVALLCCQRNEHVIYC